MALITAVGVFAYNLGAFHEMHAADGTYMHFSTFGIYSLFVFASVWCGIKCWELSGVAKKLRKLRKGDDTSFHKSAIQAVQRNAEIGWFAADMCLTLGMIGTVWGFYQMFQGENLADIDVSNAKSMLALIGQVARGMSTALSTTLVGLVANAMLKIQFFNLDHALDGVKNET